MFVPNNRCRLQLSTDEYDLYGQPKPRLWTSERCSVVSLDVAGEKTSVRADSSATRGNARELVADAVVLLTKATRAGIDDIIEVGGYQFRIFGKEPKFDAQGLLDHYRISAEFWSQS